MREVPPAGRDGHPAPEPIARRGKIAVHHGGGLQQGAIRRLEKETGTEERGRFYAACFAELVRRAVGCELEPAGPWSLFEAAVRRVRDGADGR